MKDEYPIANTQCPMTKGNVIPSLEIGNSLLVIGNSKEKREKMNSHFLVIPAEAGIQDMFKSMDSRLRGNDRLGSSYKLIKMKGNSNSFLGNWTFLVGHWTFKKG